MPVHKQGKGFQWGSKGHVYTGPGAAAKAAAQGRAAYANGYRGMQEGGAVPQRKPGFMPRG